MRKFSLFVMCLLVVLTAWAIPADKTPVEVSQRDGSTLTLRLVGDEFFHYNTTIDGYTVLRNTDGSYEYAVKRGNVLVTSGVLAHDKAMRSQAEVQLLGQVGKHVRAANDVQRARKSRAQAQKPASREPVVDYSKFKGLIILINYTDRQFGMDDPHEFYDQMVNQENYTGFNFNGRFQRCTGSMYDYFNDQSNGIFKPKFDIVGPIDLNYASTDHGGTNGSWPIFSAAYNQAQSMVNMSDYDNDGDGVVDMVYFLVAGYSSNYSGNNEDYLWPHKSYLYDYQNDAWFPYASSTEIYGWESQNNPIPLGIGTMTHEFSHVLGLPDLYDTDYSEHGQSHDPGGWDVMAGGDYNMGRTPCAYSAWERYALGWNQPQEIKATGSFSLQNVGTTGDGLILRTPVEGEFFMLDNRQKVKWDAYLPGHGMLIARVDSTNENIWWENDVNSYPSHNYYELLRAGNSTSGTSSSDPFPGSNDVTEVGNLTEPSLRTWAGIESLFELKNIRETQGVITFDVVEAVPPEVLVEDFEQMAVTTNKNLKQVQGRFAKWNFSSACVAAPGSDLCDGQHAVQMVKPSVVAMAEPLMVHAFRIEYTAYNSSSADAKFTLYSSPDGQNWEKMNNEYFNVPGGQSATYFQTIETTMPMYYRITMAGGSSNQPCYVDNIKFYYDRELVVGDVDGDGLVDIADVNAIINTMLGKENYRSADVDANGVVDIADVNRIINLMLNK